MPSGHMEETDRKAQTAGFGHHVKDMAEKSIKSYL
jgi:hypothetical protein